jgi:hypothetical protein
MSTTHKKARSWASEAGRSAYNDAVRMALAILDRAIVDSKTPEAALARARAELEVLRSFTSKMFKG